MVELAPPVEERSQGSVLEDILVIDGVTDLAVYRILSGRWEPRDDVEPAEPERSSLPADQLPLFLLGVPGGEE